MQRSLAFLKYRSNKLFLIFIEYVATDLTAMDLPDCPMYILLQVLHFNDIYIYIHIFTD